MDLASCQPVALTVYALEALIDNQQVSWEEITLKDDRLRVREEMSVAVRPFCALTYIHYCSGLLNLYSAKGGKIPPPLEDIT